MDNPFKKMLDTKRETFSTKSKSIGQPLKANCMIMFVEEGKQYTDLEYDFVYHQYQELHPQLCDEHELTDEMLKKFWDKQFGEK